MLSHSSSLRFRVCLLIAVAISNRIEILVPPCLPTQTHTMTTFLRPVADTANTAEWSRPEGNGTQQKVLPPREIWQHLQHGDLVYDPDGYRADSTFVVVSSATEEDADDSNRNDNTQQQQFRLEDTLNSSGYCVIPRTVSRHIEDPVAF